MIIYSSLKDININIEDISSKHHSNELEKGILDHKFLTKKFVLLLKIYKTMGQSLEGVQMIDDVYYESGTIVITTLQGKPFQFPYLIILNLLSLLRMILIQKEFVKLIKILK